MKVTNGNWNKFGPYQLQNTESGLLDLEIDTALTCDDVEKSWCRSNSFPAGLVLQPLPLGVSFHKTKLHVHAVYSFLFVGHLISCILWEGGIHELEIQTKYLFTLVNQ